MKFSKPRFVSLPVICCLMLLGCAKDYNTMSDFNVHGSDVEICPAFSNVEMSLKEELQHRDSLTRIFNSLSCYDGGNLEDIYRAIGVVFTKRPIAVLAAIHEAQLEEAQISSVLTILPLTFVDKPCEKVTELNKRKTLLEASDEYLEERKKGLSAISKSLSRVQKYCHDAS